MQEYSFFFDEDILRGFSALRLVEWFRMYRNVRLQMMEIVSADIDSGEAAKANFTAGPGFPSYPDSVLQGVTGIRLERNRLNVTLCDQDLLKATRQLCNIMQEANFHHRCVIKGHGHNGDCTYAVHYEGATCNRDNAENHQITIKFSDSPKPMVIKI